MQTTPHALIEANRLTKKFGEKLAVDDASFKVQGGEIFASLARMAARPPRLKCWSLLKPTSARRALPDLISGSAAAGKPQWLRARRANLYAKLRRASCCAVGDLYQLEPAQVAVDRRVAAPVRSDRRRQYDQIIQPRHAAKPLWRLRCCTIRPCSSG